MISNLPLDKMVFAYCITGPRPLNYEKELAKDISLQLKALPIIERWGTIQKINREFSRKTNDPQKIALLKKALCHDSSKSWRKELLDTHYQVELDLSYQLIRYCNYLDRPIR